MAKDRKVANGRKDFLARAKENGVGVNTGIVTGKLSEKRLGLVTKEKYQISLDQWNRFVREEWPNARFNDVESLQAFVRTLGYSIDGIKNLPAADRTIYNYWMSFKAAVEWKYGVTICPNISEGIRRFIYGDLKEELGSLGEKRPRRYPNKNHLLLYARQYWAADWFIYKKPGTRVDDWGLFLANTFTTSRIGEYIESTARPGTERGLYYKDVMFVCFWNEDHKPELAIILTKDAKNMFDLPKSKRPKYALAEGREPDLLCFNTLLPYLSKLLKLKAFRDHKTIEELLSVEPPEHLSAHHIPWEKDLLDKPFFVSQFRDGRIETANSFTKRHGAMGRRGGFPEPPTGHDWRAELLTLIDKHYSEAARMGAGAHTNPGTFGKYYQTSLSEVDGQAVLLGNTRRDLSAVFRELTIPWNPNLSQRLPAEEQYKLERSKEFLGIEQEVGSLRGKKDPQSVCRRKELYHETRMLKNRALREWQLNETYKPGEQRKYHHRMFDRCSFMMPVRKRLAVNMFMEGTLRSPTGLAVLRDMMALHEQNSEVEFRPGLEPNKCCCQKTGEGLQTGFDDSCANYDWKHIYNCYKENLRERHGDAEFCFLCDEWILGKRKWSDHCLLHLNDMDNFPIHFDPLVCCGVLATPGYCPWCLGNAGLPPTDRMHQYLNREKWLTHLRGHLKKLKLEAEASQALGKIIKPMKCPHPERCCPRNFDSVLELQFHLQDIHGIDMEREPLQKRAREESEGIRQGPAKKLRGTYNAKEYCFVNTIEEPCETNGSISTTAEGSYRHHNGPPKSRQIPKCNSSASEIESEDELPPMEELLLAREGATLSH